MLRKVSRAFGLVLLFHATTNAEIIAVKIAEPAVPNPETCCDYGFYQFNYNLDMEQVNWITFNDSATLTDGVPTGTMKDYWKIVAATPEDFLVIWEWDGANRVLYGELNGEVGPLNSLFVGDGQKTIHAAPYIRVQGNEGYHGEVWVLVNFSPIKGDFNGDDVLDAVDINLLSERMGPTTHIRMDFDRDNRVTVEDHRHLVQDLIGTTYGDANLDLIFDSTDLVLISQAGKYETGQYAGWQEGDFNADRLFASDDLTLALQTGAYEVSSPQEPFPVPEPSTAAIAVGMMFGGAIQKSRRREQLSRERVDRERRS